MTNDSNEAAEVGTCDLCGQEMIRTEDDCWHPWNVAKACPPEPSSADYAAYSAWRAAGNESLCPGRQHFIPAGSSAPHREPEPFVGPPISMWSPEPWELS